MTNGIINVLVRWTGLAKAWNLFNGKKSYIAGAGLILAGAAQIAAQIAASSAPADLLNVAKQIPESDALKLILQGLGIVGLRHSQEKAAEPQPQPESK